MHSKPLILNRIRLAQAATGFSPADFPIGSLESRAAARALLDQVHRMKPKLSQYDSDATMSYGMSRLWGHCLDGTSPGSKDIEKTAIYQHGCKLEQEPCDDEVRSHFESKDFDRLGRIEEILTEVIERSGCDLKLPPKDAAWHDAAMWCLAHSIAFTWFKQAWERQLSHLPFPIEVRTENEDVRLYLRQTSGEWKEETDKAILGPTEELKLRLREEGLTK
jgi:hypothetical protein